MIGLGKFTVLDLNWGLTRLASSDFLDLLAVHSVPNSQDDVEVNLGLIYTVLVDIQHDPKHSGTPIISYCIVSYSEPA